MACGSGLCWLVRAGQQLGLTPEDPAVSRIRGARGSGAMTTRFGSILLATVATGASVFTAVQVAAPANAAFPGRNGRIAFTMQVATGPHRVGSDIFTIHPDGTDLRRLTFSHDASSPAWAPRGHRILYQHGSGIWMMHGDGQHKVRVTPGADPVWAPGGQRFAFTATGKRPGTRNASQVWVYTFKTRTARQLTDFSYHGQYWYSWPVSLSWSSRGVIAFERYSTDTFMGDYHRTYLFTVARDGSQLHRLPHTARAGDPEWAPSGRRFVSTWDATSDPNGEPFPPDIRRLVIRRPDGIPISRIHVPGTSDTAWSPNRRWIACARPLGIYRPSPQPGLWLTRPDGTDRHRILVTTPTKRNSVLTVDWQPLSPN